MSMASRKILCVGQDLGLLRSRCAVLNQAGYDACCLGPAEAELILNIQQLRATDAGDSICLVILSATLSEAHKARVAAAAGSKAIINLEGFTFVPNLLSLVQEALGQDLEQSA